jgi:hypothetical protein
MPPEMHSCTAMNISVLLTVARGSTIHRERAVTFLLQQLLGERSAFLYVHCLFCFYKKKTFHKPKIKILRERERAFLSSEYKKGHKVGEAHLSGLFQMKVACSAA